MYICNWHKNFTDTCGLPAGNFPVQNPLPAPAKNPWERGYECIRICNLRVFPRVYLWVPTGYPNSCHALSDGVAFYLRKRR